MPLEFEFRITGNYKKVRRDLERLPVVFFERAIGPAVLAAAEVIARHARATTLFEDRTGLLRNSIRAELASARYRDARGRWYTAALAAAQVKIDPAIYGYYLNYGTEHISPRPFLTNAVLQTREQQRRAFTRALRKHFPNLPK